MKIIHIITSLGDGGAESNLYKICALDQENEHIVISLLNEGKYGILLKKKNIKVFTLKLSILNFFFSCFQLFKIIYQNKPNVVQTWLYHADFLGGIVAKILCVKKIVWNIRSGNLVINKTKFLTLVIRRLLAFLSNYIPDVIISCSNIATKIHVDLGYKKNKILFIPNGFDLSVFENSKNKIINLKYQLKIKQEIPLLAMVARFDPQKDHVGLLKALQILKNKNLNFFLILVGNLVTKNNQILSRCIKKFKLTNQVKLLGSLNNIPQLMKEIDIYISSSFGEAFPNVVAEAMAAGTPCVVTDVGESSSIVKNTGWVVPPNNPKLLSIAIQRALNEYKYINKWNIRRKNCKILIKKNYNIFKVIKEYKKVWNETGF